jgi:hypothetical protein
MSMHTIIRSPGAIALGAFFASVTGYVLFKDGIDGAAVTTNHVLNLAALVAALASGHFVWPEVRSGRIVPAALLSILFLGATAFVIINADMRNAETAAAKAAVIAQANAERARVESERARLTQLRDDAQDMLAKEQAKYNSQCEDKKTAKATNCRAIKTSVDMYTGAVRGHSAALAELPPTKPKENAGYAHAAEVIAAIPGVPYPPAEIERRLKLLMPALMVVISELGTLAFLHLGIGHVRRPKPAAAVEAELQAAKPPPPQPQPPNDPNGPRGTKRGTKPRAKNPGTSGTNSGTGPNIVAFPRVPQAYARRLQVAEAALLGHLRQHGSTDALGQSNRAIADALGVCRTTLARAAQRLASQGVVAIDTHKNGTRFTLRVVV